MKKLLTTALLGIVLLTVFSCNDEETWDKYEDWRNANQKWLAEQMERTNEDGTPYFTKVVPSWDSQAFVLMKFFNDTTLTQGNLKPLISSTIDVKYKGQLYNDEPFDSSYLRTFPADSIFRTRLQDVIPGWAIGVMKMHVGDSCEIVIPYQYAYGETGSGIINPYSVLKFGIKLAGIPGYEVPVKK